MNSSIISKSLKTLLKEGDPESAFLIWEVSNSSYYVQVALSEDSLLSFNINGVSGKVRPDETRMTFSAAQLTAIAAVGWVESRDEDEDEEEEEDEEEGDGSRYSFLDDVGTDDPIDAISEHDFFVHIKITSPIEKSAMCSAQPCR